VEPALTFVESILLAELKDGRWAGSLGGRTALIADVSDSMARDGGCLEFAAAVAWRLDQAPAGEAGLEVYQFGADAQLIAVRRQSGLDRWRALFTVPPPAVPGISRIVIVTDGYENRPPRLAPLWSATARP
jgi:hypothetical protein